MNILHDIIYFLVGNADNQIRMLFFCNILLVILAMSISLRVDRLEKRLSRMTPRLNARRTTTLPKAKDTDPVFERMMADAESNGTLVGDDELGVLSGVDPFGD